MELKLKTGIKSELLEEMLSQSENKLALILRILENIDENSSEKPEENPEKFRETGTRENEGDGEKDEGSGEKMPENPSNLSEKSDKKSGRKWFVWDDESQEILKQLLDANRAGTKKLKNLTDLVNSFRKSYSAKTGQEARFNPGAFRAKIQREYPSDFQILKNKSRTQPVKKPETKVGSLSGPAKFPKSTQKEVKEKLTQEMRERIKTWVLDSHMNENQVLKRFRTVYWASKVPDRDILERVKIVRSQT